MPFRTSKLQRKNAAKTLMLMGGILGLMFTGITLLAYWYGITPNEKSTVVSQIAESTFGRGGLYFFIQGITAVILFLAANTAYSAFPLLAFMFAKDKYLPHAFMVRETAWASLMVLSFSEYCRLCL